MAEQSGAMRELNNVLHGLLTPIKDNLKVD
jgi:hypothetical protein